MITNYHFDPCIDWANKILISCGKSLGISKKGKIEKPQLPPLFVYPKWSSGMNLYFICELASVSKVLFPLFHFLVDHGKKTSHLKEAKKSPWKCLFTLFSSELLIQQFLCWVILCFLATDFLFARTILGRAVPFATAGDCYSAARCPQVFDFLPLEMCTWEGKRNDLCDWFIPVKF